MLTLIVPYYPEKRKCFFIFIVKILFVPMTVACRKATKAARGGAAPAYQ